MKKRIIFVVSAIMCIVICALGFAACNCGSVNSYHNLAAEGEIYLDGEQTVSISVSEYADEEKTTFKQSITAKDVSVTGVLSGKTVTAVKYVDAETIEVTFTGKVTADKSHAEEIGEIVVSNNALNNGANGIAVSKVNFEPKMSRMYNLNGGLGGRISEYSLPYGSFIAENVNLNNISVTLSGDATATVSVTDEGKLRIDVRGFKPFEENGTTYSYPQAKLNANVTTFNKEITVNVGSNSFFETYSLV